MEVLSKKAGKKFEQEAMARLRATLIRAYRTERNEMKALDTELVEDMIIEIRKEGFII